MAHRASNAPQAAHPSVIFQIHSEPRSMLSKNARIAFNEALLNPKVFAHLGSIGPMTDYTPQAYRHLPPRLGGLNPGNQEYGAENEALIRAAASYHKKLDEETIPARDGSAFDHALQIVAGASHQFTPKDNLSPPKGAPDTVYLPPSKDAFGADRQPPPKGAFGSDRLPHPKGSGLPKGTASSEEEEEDGDVYLTLKRDRTGTQPPPKGAAAGEANDAEENEPYDPRPPKGETLKGGAAAGVHRTKVSVHDEYGPPKGNSSAEAREKDDKLREQATALAEKDALADAEHSERIMRAMAAHLESDQKILAALDSALNVASFEAGKKRDALALRLEQIVTETASEALFACMSYALRPRDPFRVPLRTLSN